MNGAIEITVVSPTETLLEASTRGVEIPAVNGELGVLPDHAAAIVQLKPGMVKILGERPAETAYFFVAGGFFQIRDNKATLMAETIEARTRIDRDRAGKAEGRALQRLDGKGTDVDISRALASLARARARLKLAELREKS
jgi:F-type H+-transporting ATPase subunit epsilon